MWKEAVVVYFKTWSPRILLGLRTNIPGIFDLRVEIKT
jgi:hypothetical protein